MARSSANAVLSAVAISIVTLSLGKVFKQQLRGKQSKRRQQRSKDGTCEPTDNGVSEPDMLLSKLFGDEGCMCIVVDAVQRSDDDNEIQLALEQLFVLIFAVALSVTGCAYAIATGSFLVAATALAVAGRYAPPAAVDVHRCWGHCLDEALDESIKTTTVPWDLAVI